MSNPPVHHPVGEIDKPSHPGNNQRLTIQGRQTIAHFQSPLPPAEYLETYRRIDPNAPKLLMDIFLKQATHRMECERNDLNARIRLRTCGQRFGIIFALAALTAGILVAYFGHPVVSGIVFGTTIPFCAVVFVLGREPKSMPPPPSEKTPIKHP